MNALFPSLSFSGWLLAGGWVCAAAAWLELCRTMCAHAYHDRAGEKDEPR